MGKLKRIKTPEYSVSISRDADKKLTFESSNGGELINITDESRSFLIPLRDLIKEENPVFKNLYIVKHPDIIGLARKEAPYVDAIFIHRPYARVVIVADSCTAKWITPLV